MKKILKQIHHLLIINKKNIAVAESVTGGIISNLLTQVPGSSHYFILGIVAYSNKAKENILKISPRLIAKKGAVSKEVAQKMASGIRRLAQADIGIGITGIAGPSGRTKEKPLGTVFIAVDTGKNKLSDKFIFRGNRNTVRKRAALKSLELLIKELK